MLIIKKEIWIIIQSSKKKRLNISKIYKKFKIKYNYINFAGITALWDKLYIFNFDFTNINIYKKTIFDIYN